MKIKISSTLVLGLIGGMLAGCGNGGSQDSLTNTSSTSSKLLSRHVKAAACVAWVSGGTYTAGEVVTYNGANYTALVTQTDYAGTGWNPTVASLFSPGGSCGGTPTPTPAPTPAPAPTPTPTPSGPAGYTFCANENGTCNLSGANTVAFGANGDFNYQTITGNASCTDTVFGDPDVGVVKACYYLPAPAPTPTPAGPTGPAGYTFCANENGTCNLFGSNTVAFGANGKFNYQSITGNVSCANTVFGDPDVGVVKACFYTSTPGLTSGASYNFVNPESNLVLDEAGCGTSNGTNVQLWANGVGACNGGAGQIWVPTLNSDGTYTITNPGSNMVLDLAGCGGAGANVDMWANGVGVCNGGAGQKWAFTLNSDGTYTITNPSSGLALDVASCGTTDGTNVDVWTNGVNVCNGGGGQKWQPVLATPTPTHSMLQTSGRNIVDANGNIVKLRGVNLGGWFIMEKWMAPLDSGSLPDTYSVIQELDNRFGVAAEQNLITTYQQNWITTSDLDNIKNAGFNLIRVPVWWGQFYPLNNVSNSGWRSDAFTMLDWLVSNAASRGLYVIIDMHGVIGGQSVSDDTGQANQNTYWTNGSNQGNTAWMWWQIANHYNGNPTVAGYDLINEPDGAPSTSAVWTAYSNLYNTVRSVDPNHMIFMEGTFGSWDWSMLPPPSQYGWTNVVYEMHEYQYNAPASQVESGSTNQVSDFNNHASWNVPGYIGEFNDFGYGASTWQFSINAYDNAGLSWSSWSYKATHGLLPDSWGWYDPTYWPTTPNISTDSAATIAADWQQWQTTTSFGLNTSIGLQP